MSDEAELKLTGIVAMTSERIIGMNGDLPWHLPEDLKMFKKMTTDHPVVMGRKTWDSLGKYQPLPNRQNIVVTRDVDWHEEGAEVIYSPETLQHIDLIDPHVFIIGGAQIYELFMNYMNELIVTHVKKNHVGDTYFPEYSERFQEYMILDENEKFEVRKYFLRPDFDA